MTEIMKTSNMIKMLLIFVGGMIFLIMFMLGFRQWFITLFMTGVVCWFLVVSGATTEAPLWQIMVAVLSTFFITWGVQQLSMFPLSVITTEETASNLSNVVALLVASLFVVSYVTLVKTRGRVSI